MTKAELIKSVASQADLPRATAEDAANALFDAMVAALQRGNDVRITGFGTFAVVTRKARTGRNPKTGESVEIAAARKVKFKASDTLKDALK